MRRLIRTATFWIALMIPAASLPIHAAEHQRPAILVLFGGDSSQLWNRDIGDGVNDAVLKQTTDSPVLYFEYVDLIRFPESAVAERLAAALREKYEGRRLDLIVTVTPAVNDFAALWRARLWPDAPVLFTSYTETVSERVVAAPQSSGLSLAWGSADALTSLQQVLPGLKRVALIAGTSALERTGRVVYLDEIRRHGLDALDMTGTSVSDMLPALAHLPDHSAVMITGLVDADGQMVPAWSLCQLVSQAANAPTVMLGSQFLGCGIMGGRMRDFRTMGALIGERAMAMLAGREFVNTFVPFARISTLAFDARQLERFNIDEGRLPPGSVVSFRRPNLWRDYGRVIASGLAAIALEAALIVGLVYERRQRIKAETDSRRHLSLAAHADRREAMSALEKYLDHMDALIKAARKS